MFDQETHDMAIRFIEIYYKYFKDRFQFDDLVLCHGDLNLKNIIVQDSSYRGIKDKVMLIDFDFSGPHHPMYDLANFFREWVGDDFNLDLLPTEKQKRSIVKKYLKKRSNQKIKSRQVDQAMTLITEFETLSDFHWAIWAYHYQFKNDLHHKRGQGFDYLLYGLQRLSSWKKSPFTLILLTK